MALALFGSAGTVHWWRAWTLLVVLVVIRSVGARVVFRVNPALLLERAKLPIQHGQSLQDRILVFAMLTTGFVGMPIIAGIDRFRLQSLALPNAVLSAFGLILFASGWILKSRALHANAFAVAAVRIQHEREHIVVDTGIYGRIRHPFYAADPLIFVGLGLWLESYLAVLCAVIPICVGLLRLHLEEQVLRRELPGYREYVERVPHRLIPGIW
ncbi:MAG: isoprenylcysteine carboxylmethyltransferase family protein [Gemmatimonas sp.]